MRESTKKTTHKYWIVFDGHYLRRNLRGHVTVTASFAPIFIVGALFYQWPILRRSSGLVGNRVKTRLEKYKVVES